MNSAVPGTERVPSPAVVHTITVSCGPRTNPLGMRHVFSNGDVGAAATLADLLIKIEPGTETWWSQHTWQGDRRNCEKWIAASALVVDLDYHDANGKHAAPAVEIRARLEQAAREGKLPGNIFHLTPHGARMVFVLPAPIT